MKFLKIELRKTPGSSNIQYPINYQSELGDFAVDHLYYDENDNGFLLLVIPNKYFKATMIRKDVTEITEAEAKIIGDKHNPTAECITNEAVIRRLEIKSNLGQTLTPDEEKALNPNDLTLGIGLKKGLSDRIVEKKQHEIASN